MLIFISATFTFEINVKVSQKNLLFALELRYDMVEPGVGVGPILPVGGTARITSKIMHISLNKHYFRVNMHK